MRQEGDPSDRNRRSINSVEASSAIMRNTAWNFLGTILPLLLALITIPLLIHSIGTERFGVLTIAWVVLGYFGFFDLGLGRATTKFLAEAFEHDRVAEVRALFWTSLILNAGFGLIGASTLAGLSPLLVSRVLNIPAGLQAEALGAFYLMACGVPLVILVNNLRGVLEAQHRFDLTNVLLVPYAALTQAAPLLVLPFSYDLTWLVGAMVFSRLLSTMAFFVVAFRQLESPFEGPFFLRKKLGSLFSYGGWLTVMNVLGPLMVYGDRFVIGSLSSMTAVAYYVTPYGAITRLGILPISLTRTLFPIFSSEPELGPRTRIYSNAIKHLTLVLTPIVATIIVFAPDLLRLWVGEAFVENSTAVLQILAVGVFVHSLAIVPNVLLHGLGRPDITAKFRLLELPFYLILLWYGVWHWGIVGAAVAWTARVSVDALLLVLYVQLTRRVSYASGWTKMYRFRMLSVLVVLSGWLLYVLTNSLSVKVAIWGLFLGVIFYGGWHRLLTPTERQTLAEYVSRAFVGAQAVLSAFKSGRSGR
jgi:O-antigen/teichoic acid export membrane protein